MSSMLRKKVGFGGMFFLAVVLCAFSLLGAGEIPFEHVIIDSGFMGHRKVGDVDRDGYNDIVAVNSNAESKRMLVWYRYPKWEKYLIADITKFEDYKGYGACDMEVADIDGDGDLDVVGRLRKSEAEGVNCWFENPAPEGDLTKDTWKRHDLGMSKHVKDIKAVDLNGDGKLDVVSRALNAKLHIYFQNSPTSWKERVLDITHHDGMEAADIDRDGDPDIVLNGYWLETPDEPLTGEWNKHDIDQMWYTQRSAEDGGREWNDDNCKVVVADMDNDGCLDVLISQGERKGFPVCWYKAPVDPKSGKWKQHIIGQIDYCHSLEAADMDNDGDIDVIAGEMPRWEAPCPVVVFVNEGDSLRWRMQKLTDRGNYSAAVGDIGNDGDIDVVGLRIYNEAPIEMWENKTSDNKLSLDKWSYIKVDDSRTVHKGKPDVAGWWFGLAMGDLTGDGYKDIAAGKWFYRNPGADMTGDWARVTFDDSFDALLVVDVDGDDRGDVIAAKCNEQYWLEAADAQGSSWNAVRIGSLPICNHDISAQGYNLAQIIPGGKPEIILTGRGVYYIQIPDNPTEGNWPSVAIAESGSNGEGVAAGDVDGDGDLDICGGFRIDGVGRGVGWWENPGDGSGNWKKHQIGTTDFDADRFAAADLNADGKLDIVVAEERWPGLEPDASLFWFEQLAERGRTFWRRHGIVTQYSMNNLDAADIDRDGDVDIVVCEHKGPKEKLQIWENDGKGNFTSHLLDEGKESHLGAKLADMDGDGDFEIVSIAWDDFKYLHLWRNDAIQKTVDEIPIRPGVKDSGKYRLAVAVSAGGFERYDKPAEIEVDFTQLLKRLGSSGGFDENSIRVIEVNASGGAVDDSVVFQFDKDSDYNSLTNAKGRLVFMLKGKTSSEATRHFQVHFAKASGSCSAPVFPSRILVTDNVQHEEQESYKIETRSATYYYHKLGAGFASMIDLDGNDWISYHPGGGSAGEYRGIPNSGYPEGYFHPGKTNSNSKIINSGPIKLSILSESNNTLWACLWEIYPCYATMSLLKKTEGPYWVLYEGTPGGKLDVDSDYWVRSSGERLLVSQSWAGELAEPEWVYFGDGSLKRVLYMAHHTDDNKPDQFWQMEGNMTVFGFGREYQCCGRYLAVVPGNFTIGFAEDGAFSQASKVINSAYRELVVSVGKPEIIGN